MTPDTWEALRDDFVESALLLPEELPRALHEAERNSQRSWVFESLFDHAAGIARQAEIEPGSNASNDFLDRAHVVASELTVGFWCFRLPLHEDDRLAAMTSEDVANALRTTAEGGRLYVYHLWELRLHDVSLEDVEYGVEAYLESEFRVPSIDRMLLIALTDIQIAAFLKDDASPNAFDVLATPLPKIIKRAVMYSTSLMPVPVIKLLSWVISYDGPGSERIRQQGKVIEGMVSFRSEAHGLKALSIPGLKILLGEARRAGIDWPRMTWALLDDVERRGITSI